MDEDKKDIIELEKVEEPKNEPEPKPSHEEERKEKEEPKVEVIKEEPAKDKKGFSIAALVLGIIAIVLCCIWYISIPCGILAIIFGVLGIKSSKKGMSIAGVTTGTIGLIISLIIFFALIVLGMLVGFAEGLDGIDYNDRYYHRYEYNRDLFE